MIGKMVVTHMWQIDSGPEQPPYTPLYCLHRVQIAKFGFHLGGVLHPMERNELSPFDHQSREKGPIRYIHYHKPVFAEVRTQKVEMRELSHYSGPRMSVAR